MKDQREELTAKLRRLRKDGKPKQRAANLPPQVRTKLQARSKRKTADRSDPEGESDLALPGQGRYDVGAPAELVRMSNEHGSFALRARRFPSAHRHGEWSLSEIDAADRAEIGRLAKDEELFEVDWRRALYLDIETTGLSGGAGTIPFLVAMGVFEGDEFVLYQGFLNGPEEEAAMLADAAQRIEKSDALVSFFGKSFDRHRLEDKMRVHGIVPPFANRPHLDLYHPLRRLYGSAFSDGRLSTMETKLCGVRRIDDLSGRFAPEAWFDFLAERAHRLEDVFRHNEDDVLSLVVLAAHLGRVFSEERFNGAPLSGPGDARAAAVARLLCEGRQHEEALAWIELGLERDAGAGRALRLLQAETCAALDRQAEASRLYAELAEDADDSTTVRCLVALAKRSEHRAADPARALEYVRRAAKLTRRHVAVSRAVAKDLCKREERLVRKLGSSTAEPKRKPRRPSAAKTAKRP